MARTTTHQARTLDAARTQARSYHPRDLVGQHATILAVSHPDTGHECWALPCRSPGYPVFTNDYRDAKRALEILDAEYATRARRYLRAMVAK